MAKTKKESKAPKAKKPVKAKKVKAVEPTVKAQEVVRGFSIDEDVPVPAHRGFDSTKYPLKEMREGTSFFVEASVNALDYPDPDEAIEAQKEEEKKVQSRLQAAVRNARKNSPELKFVVRIVEGGVRVWRITPE